MIFANRYWDVGFLKNGGKTKSLAFRLKYADSKPLNAFVTIKINIPPFYYVGEINASMRYNCSTLNYIEMGSLKKITANNNYCHGLQISILIVVDFIDTIREEWNSVAINLYFENSFSINPTKGLYDSSKASYKSFKIERNCTISQLIERVSKEINCRQSEFRLWPFEYRKDCYRPKLLNLYSMKPFNSSMWNVFVEMAPKDSNVKDLPPFDDKLEVLLFFKYYDAETKSLTYFGHSYLEKNVLMLNLIKILNQLAKFPYDTKLVIYKELHSGLLSDCGQSFKLTEVNFFLIKSFISINILNIAGYR